MVKVIWTQSAIEDLKTIHDYIAGESRLYASEMITKITSRVAQLENFPESGRIVPEFHQKTIRELIVGNFRIVYKIHTRHVGIVRVVHSARRLRI